MICLAIVNWGINLQALTWISDPGRVSGSVHERQMVTEDGQKVLPGVAATGIAAGSPSAQPVSLRDVARLADVSVATVSMVVNDNPRISQATRLRVQKAVEQAGYRPNRLAQGLSTRYTRMLAVLLPPLRHAIGNPYFGEIMSGICDRAGKLGYKVVIEQAKADFVRERRHLEMYDRRFVDGMLAMGFNDSHGFLADFGADRRRYPFIAIDNTFDHLPGMDQVVCNYGAGAQQVMSYLTQLGHRRIGLIHGLTEVGTARTLADAYRAGLRAVGADDVADDATWRLPGRFTEVGGATAARALLARHPDLTAIFAGNDNMAIGAMNHLRRHGVDVPGQVSVVGFDDLHQSAYVRPALTTVHLPVYEAGMLACERLIERIRGQADRVAEVLPTHLVVRESTAMACDAAGTGRAAASITG